MSKTISDEEYEDLQRLRGLEREVEAYCRNGYQHCGWNENFKKHLKPKQYRPTLDELAEVYSRETGIGIPAHWRRGFKAVIEEVFGGMQKDYHRTDKDMVDVYNSYRESYEEE